MELEQVGAVCLERVAGESPLELQIGEEIECQADRVGVAGGGVMGLSLGRVRAGPERPEAVGAGRPAPCPWEGALLKGAHPHSFAPPAPTTWVCKATFSGWPSERVPHSQ